MSSGARLSRVESSLSRPSTSEPWKMGIACTQERRRRTEGKVARGATYQGPEAGQGGAVRWPAHRPIEWRSPARSRPDLPAVIDLRNRASGSAGAHTGRRRCVLRCGATDHPPRRGHSRGSSGAGPRCESAAGRRECAELQARGGHDLISAVRRKRQKWGLGDLCVKYARCPRSPKDAPRSTAERAARLDELLRHCPDHDYRGRPLAGGDFQSMADGDLPLPWALVQRIDRLDRP